MSDPATEREFVTSDHAVKPSRWGYGLAALVLVAGGALFTAYLVRNLTGLTDKLTQIVVPGKQDITLAAPGTYTIFHEYRSVVGDKVYATRTDVPGLRCRVTSKETGSTVKVVPCSHSSSYSLGGRSAVSVLSFCIDTPGAYEFSARYEEGHKGPETVLAVGRGFLKSLLLTIFASIALLLGTTAMAVLIAVLVFVKRHNARRRTEAWAQDGRVQG